MCGLTAARCVDSAAAVTHCAPPHSPRLSATEYILVEKPYICRNAFILKYIFFVVIYLIL